MSQDVLKRYGKGASLLLKMGYTPGKGLGENGRGIVEPILPTILKRGEGIKVDDNTKMVSRVVDDWSDSSDDEDMDIESAGGKPVDFNQSGTFKSEYDVPELFEIVRDLLQRNVEVPNEIIRKAESSKTNEDLSLRTMLFNLLKSIKADQPRIKYLEFEMDQLKLKKHRYEIDLDVMEKFKKVIEVDGDVHVDELLKIPQLREIDLELKDDLLELAMLKIQETWQQEVENCSVEDIVSFGEILDKAVTFLSLQELSSTELIKIRYQSSSLKRRPPHLLMNIVGSTILKPLLLKIESFYNTWDVSSVNLGIVVYEEVKDSDIFSDLLFDVIIMKSIILPKLIGSFSEVSLFDKIEWIVPWLELYPDYFDEMVEKIVLHYLQELKTSTVSAEQLVELPLLYWLGIAQNDKLTEIAKKELFLYILDTFRRHLDELRSDGCEFLGVEEITEMKSFVSLFKKLSLYEYEDVLYYEIMLPLRIKYLELYEKDTDYELFLSYMIQTLAYVELLSDDEHFISIQQSVRECCEHFNLATKKELSSKKVPTANDIKAIENPYAKLKDIDKLIKKKSNSTNKVTLVKPSIKDIVFEKCEANGIPVIPGRIKDGKQMYYIENKGNKYEIYFDQKVMFANYNHLKDEPIGLEELL